MWSVDGGQHFGVALFQICAAVRLTEDAQFALDAAQFVGSTTVQTEALIRNQFLLGEHAFDLNLSRAADWRFPRIQTLIGERVAKQLIINSKQIVRCIVYRLWYMRKPKSL